MVLAEIQLAVSESSSHFLSHLRTSPHGAGWWSLSEQPKHQSCPQKQRTVGTIWPSCLLRMAQSTAYSQLGAGHHLRLSLSSTYVRVSSVW